MTNITGYRFSVLSAFILRLVTGVTMKATDSVATLLPVYRTIWNEVKKFRTYIECIIAKRA
jgi:hypothetical protein